MNTTARIEIKSPKVTLSLDHVLYLRSLKGEKVHCSLDSKDRARLQLLGLVMEREDEPTPDSMRKHTAEMKIRREAVDRAYKAEDWDKLSDAAYKLKHPPQPPSKQKRMVLTKEGEQLLKDGGVTIAIKNGCGK